MDLSTIKDFKINAWYRGMKLITIISYDNNKIVFSNNDKILIKNNEIYLNNSLICNDNITVEQLLELYKYLLIKKGYKII